MRKTCGFAQNSLRFMRKNNAKVRKKKFRENSANFAQKIQPFRENPIRERKKKVYRCKES